MGRIEEGYREKLRALFRGRERREAAVELWMRKARRQAAAGCPRGAALAEAYARARRLCGPVSFAARLPEPPRFLCDGSLGALARWLRAAGYDARWARGRSGDALVAASEAEARVLLSSRSIVFDRAVIRSGRLPALWIPTDLEPPRQLQMVLADLGVGLREPRCMPCGGELRKVEKSVVASRIPPRTARWLDDYWLCTGCGALFWRGTHWQRIEERLRALRAPRSD